MPTALSPAYVLHSRPYRDSSALVDLLTLHHGLQRVVWRGARGQRRKLSPQPFVPLLVGLLGRSELKTLTQAEVAGQFTLLQGEKLFSGMYLNELLVRLLSSADPQPLLFAAYQQVLEQLANDAPVEPTLRRFEWQLLEVLGYGFSLSEDLSGAGLPGHALLAMAADDWTATITLRAAKQLMRQALAVHLGDRPLVSRQLFARQTPSHKGDEQ